MHADASMSMRRRWPRAVLAVLAGVLLAALALQLGRVDAGLGAPFGPDRLVRAVDAAPGVSADDAGSARRALRDRPVDGRAYRVLAQVAAAAGQPEQAQRLHHTAIARWPRDRMARAVLAEQAFARDDIETGLTHVDALLRVAPSARKALLAALLPALGDERMRRGLVTRLSRDPPWRSALPGVLSDASAPAREAEALLAALATQLPPSDAEMQARMVLLDRLGEAGRARGIWLAALPPADRAAAGRVFDGGFERPGVEGAYAWRFDAPAGVSLGYDTAAAYAGQGALLVEFGGRAVRFSGVRQALALEPGRYRLRMMARNEVETTRPFLWQLRCNGGEAAPLATLAVPASTQWQALSQDFEVPAACAAQTLQLHHASRSLAERSVRGALRFDALGIFPGS